MERNEGKNSRVEVALALRRLALEMNSQAAELLRQTMDIESRQLVEKLNALGVNLSIVPENVYPGMPYLTVNQVYRQRLTSYSLPQLYNLVHDETISSVRLGEQDVFDVHGIDQIINRDQTTRGKRKGRKPQEPRESLPFPQSALTVRQAAEIIGCRPENVRQLILSGRFPAIKPGHDWLITEPEVIYNYRPSRIRKNNSQ